MNAVFSDIIDGLRRWPLIFLLGWRDTVSAYRRSFFGPVWLFIQTVLWVFFIGLVFGKNLGAASETYLLYVAVGMVAFQLMALMVADGTSTFLREASLIKNIPIPVSVYVFRVAARAFFTFWFEMPVIIGAFLWLGIMPNAMGVLLSIAGTVLTMWAFLGAAFGLAVLGTLIRDIVPVIAVALRVAFFATPIFWLTDGIDGARQILSTINPLSHFMVIIRDPLMGVEVPMQSWLICIGMGCGFWVVGLSLFTMVRSRLAALL